MAPTPSVYLYTGEDAVDEAVWPPAGIQAPAMEGEPARPLYHFAGDNQAAEPATTNGANVPGWELYTGPTEPVLAPAETPSTPVDPPASTSEPTATEQASPVPPPPVSVAAAPGEAETPQTDAAPAETPSGDTVKPDAPATETTPAAATQTPAVPAAVIEGTVYRGRDDDDVLTGSFCRVITGEQQGRYGVYVKTATLFPDGWPATVTIHTRDDRDELITVNYADIRPAQPGGR